MKINALTAMRAIAAIMVVIHHYGSNLPPFSLCGNLFRSGNLSVGFFFILSGFVLTLAHPTLQVRTFYVKRLLRIGPAYFAALLLTVGMLLWLYPPPDKDMPRQFVASALFIQSFIPRYTLELNSPAWSVSNEMFFYLLFPFIWRFRNRRKLLMMATAFVYIISQCVHVYYAPRVWALSGSGIYFSPFLHLNQFLIGITGALYFHDLKMYLRARWVTYAAAAAIIILILIRPENISYNDGLIAPFFLLLIMALAARNKWLIDFPALVFLGEISFGIYIYQFPVFRGFEKLNKLYWHTGPGLLFCISLAVLVAVAALSYYLLERRALRLLRRS